MFITTIKSMSHKKKESVFFTCFDCFFYHLLNLMLNKNKNKNKNMMMMMMMNQNVLIYRFFEKNTKQLIFVSSPKSKGKRKKNKTKTNRFFFLLLAFFFCFALRLIFLAALPTYMNTIVYIN